MSTLTFAAFVGIDWADEEHVVCVLSPEELSAECETLSQQAEALDAWAAKLRERFGGRPIAVCMEASRGPLVYALMKYDHLTLFPLNPKQLAKYRQAFAPSGAKSDPGDAELLARFLREHQQHLRAWRPDDPLTRELRLLVEDRRGWVDERTAAGNRLLRHLKEVYPLALTLCGKHVYAETFLQLLKSFPAEHELRRASPKQLARYLSKRRRRADDSEVDPRIVAIRQAKPLVTDTAVLRHGRLAVQQLVAQLRQLNAAIEEYDREIAAVMEKHPDQELFASFHGAGAALVPRLIAAFGSDRTRFASAAELQTFAGVAPVTVQSGKSRHVKMRRACPHFLRQTFHEFARCSLKSSRWAKAYCTMLRAKGHPFHAAIRALAFKWLRVLFRCWQTKKPYDEDHYLQRLRQTHSPLLAHLPPKTTPESA